MKAAFTVENHPDRATWLAARSSSLGASEAAALWGLSTHDSYYSLWQKKAGVTPPSEEDETNEYAEIGLELEAPIARLAQRKSKRTFEDWGRTTVLRSVEWPWLTCTLDYVQVGVADKIGPGPIDCKNRGGGWAAKEWEDGVPLDIWAQLQQQMIVTGFVWASAAVLLNGNQIRVIDVDRDDEWCELHIEKSREFWRLVKTKTPPSEIDGSELTSKAVKLWLPTRQEAEVALPDAAIALIEEIEHQKAAKKAAEEAQKAAENQLRVALALANCARGRLPDGSLLTLKEIHKPASMQAASTYTKVMIQKPKKARSAA